MTQSESSRFARLEQKLDKLSSNQIRVEVEIERRFSRLDNDINSLRVTLAELRQGMEAGFRRLESLVVNRE